jgi:hypothetical protein
MTVRRRSALLVFERRDSLAALENLGRDVELDHEYDLTQNVLAGVERVPVEVPVPEA